MSKLRQVKNVVAHATPPRTRSQARSSFKTTQQHISSLLFYLCSSAQHISTHTACAAASRQMGNEWAAAAIASAGCVWIIDCRVLFFHPPFSNSFIFLYRCPVAASTTSNIAASCCIAGYDCTQLHRAPVGYQLSI